MRKGFTVTISVFLVLALALILMFDKDVSDSLSVITINQDYQRLMTEGEELSITVYISSDKSFVSNIDNIDTLYLKDEFNEMEVGISDLRKLDYKEVYQKTEYNAYVFDLNFNIISINDFVFELNNAFLIINYLNGEEIDLEIGDISLNFTEYVNPNYIDIYRMFAMYKVSDFEYISGIVLGINNLTGMDISVTNIDIGNKEVALDIEHSVFLTEIPDYQADIDGLLQYPYNPIGDITINQEISLSQDNLVFIPFKYMDEIIRANRFPLIIDFNYNQLEYSYYVDDFQFNSKTLGLEANNGRIREFIYHY